MGHCDGLLLVIPRTDAALVEQLTRRGSCIVLVGDSRSDSRVTTADVDNVDAARRLTEYLIGLGHQRIAAFCGNADFLSSNQRLEGYREALIAAGIPWRDEFVFSGEYNPDFGANNVRLMLRRFDQRIAERPTAIFCFNDYMARGAVEALLAEGIHIPNDISVTGFDDSTYALASEPHLTTMHHDVRRIGERATEALLDCIEGKTAPGVRIYVPAELTIRATTAPPP